MNQCFLLSFVLSVIVNSFGVSSRGLPSYINVCKRTDPDLNGCIIKAVEAIKPHLKDGIPDLGVPSLNPLIIPYAGLSAGPSFNASFKNIEIFNAHEFKVDKFNLNMDDLSLNIAVAFPKLRVKSTYSVDGKILFIELKGSGPADGNFTNVYAEVSGNGKKIEKNGKTYMEIGDMKVKADYGKPVILFSELFDNQEVTDQTNKIINQNIEDIIKELEPFVNEVILEIVRSLMSRVLSKFTFDELFPQ